LLHNEICSIITVLTTKDKAKALAWAREIGDNVRVEEITPKKKG